MTVQLDAKSRANDGKQLRLPGQRSLLRWGRRSIASSRTRRGRSTSHRPGDPTGTGSGGPGYSLPVENATPEFTSPGILAMAKPNEAGALNNGSQFFFTLQPEPTLDGKFTVFGKVTGGLDVLVEPDSRGTRKRSRIRRRARASSRSRSPSPSSPNSATDSKRPPIARRPFAVGGGGCLAHSRTETGDEKRLKAASSRCLLPLMPAGLADGFGSRSSPTHLTVRFTPGTRGSPASRTSRVRLYSVLKSRLAHRRPEEVNMPLLQALIYAANKSPKCPFEDHSRAVRTSNSNQRDVAVPEAATSDAPAR